MSNYLTFSVQMVSNVGERLCYNCSLFLRLLSRLRICLSFSSMMLSTFYDLLSLTHAYNFHMLMISHAYDFHMLTVFTCFPFTYFVRLPCTIKPLCKRP